MTTRAEEIAGDGPYTVRYDNGRYVLDGPTPTVGFWALEEWDAQNHADELNAAYKQGQQDRWISAEDRLPENMNKVMAFSRFPDGDWYQNIVTYHEKHGFLNLQQSFVTHWMPLPPSPPPAPHNPEQR